MNSQYHARLAPIRAVRGSLSFPNASVTGAVADQTLAELEIKNAPIKIFIGRVERGFDFLAA